VIYSVNTGIYKWLESASANSLHGVAV